MRKVPGASGQAAGEKILKGFLRPQGSEALLLPGFPAWENCGHWDCSTISYVCLPAQNNNGIESALKDRTLQGRYSLKRNMRRIDHLKTLRKRLP